MADANAHRPQRPRTSSMLSWGSHKSRDSGSKLELAETERDKAQRRIKGKADPSVAINEMQPSMQALEKNTLAPLRTMQFRDHQGELITDPDRSNPTRPRLERPLDTIRSFEAAIDSSYGRRYSAAPDMQSRRSSFYQGSNTPRTPGANTNPYFDRVPGSRPESIYDQQTPQSAGAYGGYGGYGGGYGNGQSRRMPHGRMTSEPAYGQHPQGHMNGSFPYHQGYESATASSSGTYQTEHGSGSTDPSSYNGSNGEINQTASYGRPQPPVTQDRYGVDYGSEMDDEYGQPVNGYGQPPAPPSHRQSYGRGYGNPADMNSGPPAPPPKSAAAPPPPPPHKTANRASRKPVGQYGSRSQPAYGHYDSPSSPSERPKPEKRKSWLARRFSRHD